MPRNLKMTRIVPGKRQENRVSPCPNSVGHRIPSYSAHMPRGNDSYRNICCEFFPGRHHWPLGSFCPTYLPLLQVSSVYDMRIFIDHANESKIEKSQHTGKFLYRHGQCSSGRAKRHPTSVADEVGPLEIRSDTI